MVYHGPSGGCKACRTRRVKCDQTRPSCNNCTRRHQSCPGYADVFDGAHRSQNKVIIRRVEKQNALRDSTPCIDNSSSNSSSSNSPAESSLSTSSSSSSSSSLVPQSKGLKKPLQWVIYSAPTPTTDPLHDGPSSTEESEEDTTALQTRPPPTDTMPPIGFTFTLKPDSEEASTCFFFHHYTGTIYDENIHNGFAMMWQPLFLRAAVDSPLRFVTTAFTVNITMMWCLKGCDTRPARRLMTKALTATRKAIQDPTPNNMDELLMTILIFDLYDSMVQHYIPVPVTSGKHKEGALALAQIRGKGNYDTPISAGLAKATRGTLLLHALRTRTRMMPGADNLFEDPSLPPTKASELEMIVMKVANLQAHLWEIRGQGEHKRQRNQDVYEAIIIEAIKLDDLLVEWRQSITDPSWLAQYIHRDDVPPSVRTAGFYGERCTVWPDLIFAEMSNYYNQSRLVNLQVVRQALADVPSLLATTENQQVLLTVNATIQRLVDAICDCVPFHLGSTTVVTNPLYSEEVEFPVKTIQHPTTGKVTTVPHHIPFYKSRAAASGGWTLFPYVCGVFRMAEPEDDAVPIDLREGQLEWIRSQVKRMQNTFLYCDPVWFKRIPKPRG